jgi:aminoglycoside 2'-N-acetyltransferase I
MRDQAAVRIRELPTGRLSTAEVDAIKAILAHAFEHDEHGGFTEDDWQHALGGTHFLLEVDGRLVGHASVVERELQVAGRSLRTGYVEAVALAPARQRQGLGTRLMRAVNEHIAERFEIGALGTGSQPFYERLGWRIWQGPTSVRTSNGEESTPDEDGFILVLETGASPSLRLTDGISCEWRPGDVW